MDENWAMVTLIKHGIEVGKQRRDDVHLREIFCSEVEGKKLVKSDIIAILGKLHVESDDLDAFLASCEADETSVISWEQFKHLVSRPCVCITRLHQWLKGLPICEVIAEAIPVQNSMDPLHDISKLDEASLQRIIEAACSELQMNLWEAICYLLKSFEAQEAKISSNSAKFQIEPMTAGSADDYYGGLEAHIGFPHLEFFKAMEAEHRITDVELKPMNPTSNPIRMSTPQDEWDLVIKRHGISTSEFMHMIHTEYPHIGFGGGHGGRRMPDVWELRQLPLSKEAKLCEEEVVAIVLYTGPMFQIYNRVLRRHPEVEYNKLEAKGYRFTTTIHVLVSAIQKLSAVTRIPAGTLLYRGLGAILDFPHSFFHADRQGRRGFAELGFMSTTPIREVAIRYSGVTRGKPKAMVVMMRVGSVNRGASIDEYSQYEHEREYLWLPLTFLQPDGISVLEVNRSGVVSIVPVLATGNFKGATVEEALQRKKKTHLVAFQFMMVDLRVQLNDLWRTHVGNQQPRRFDEGNPQDLVETIMQQCQVVFDRHQRTSPLEFTDPYQFSKMSEEMIATQRFAISKLRLWLEDGDMFALLKRRSLRESHRLMISLLKEQKANINTLGKEKEALALDLCRLKGLVHHSTEELNDSGETPLIECCADDASPNDVTLLIEAGTNVNATAKKGLSAAVKAAQLGHVLCLKVLIDAKANLDESVHVAARNGHEECLKLLIGGKANIHVTREPGGQPIHAAAWQNQASCVEILLEAHANVNAASSSNKTPLHIAAGWGHIACVSTLLRAKASLNLQTKTGATPLHNAAAFGRHECLQTLCDARGDVNKQDSAGSTPLMIAATNGKENCVAVLLKHGASRQVLRSDGLGPVEVAGQMGHEACLKLLEDVGLGENPPAACGAALSSAEQP